MDKSPSELLLYVLVFAVIVLFQYLIKRFGPQEPKDVPLPVEKPRAAVIPEEPAAVEAFPEVDAGHFGRSEATGDPEPLPRRRFARELLFGSKGAMQTAIVTATILGPCRAFEPPDDGGSRARRNTPS